MSIPFTFSGAVAVITGGGSGIGRSSAASFAARGAKVVVSDLSVQRADEVAAEIVSGGGDALGVVADVTSEDDLVALRAAALEQYGRVDLVMNNVGILAVGAPEALPDEAWQQTFDINLMSIARTNRLFLPSLIEQGRGHVINTSSASGLLAYGFDRLPYVASKHAIRGLSEALAIYLGPLGVGVTCLCPSGVATNILEGIRVFGDAAPTPRAPAHAILMPDEVGEMTADAVERGQFLVTTVPEVQPELVERATDIEAYLQQRIEEARDG